MAAPVRRRRWRLVSALFVFVAALVGAVALAIIGAAIGARTEGGRAWLRDRLVTLIAPVHGTLTIGALETDLYSEAVLRDITLADAAGNQVGHVDRLAVTYRLGGLAARRLVVPTAHAEGVDLVVTRTEAGVDIAGLWDDGGPPSEEPWRGLGIDLVLDEVTLSDVRVRYRDGAREYGLDDATLAAAVELRGPAVLVTGLRVDAPATTPALGPLALGSDLRWDPTTLWFQPTTLDLGPNRLAAEGGLGQLDAEATLGVRITALHVEPASLAALGELPVTGVFDATGGVAGLLRAPSVLLDVTTPGGRAHVNAAVDLRPVRPTWSASLAPEALELSAFLASVPAPTIVSGVVTVDGAGLTWPEDLDADAVFAFTAPRVGDLDRLEARGTAHLSKGVLDVPGVRLDGPGLGVGGAATVRLLEEEGDARVRTSTLDLAQLARFGVVGGRGRVGFTGTARYEWGDGVGVVADGLVRGTNVGWADVGEAATINGPARATWSPERGAHVVVAVDATGLEAQGYAAASARVDATLQVDPAGDLAIDGTAALGDVGGPDATLALVTARTTLARKNGRLGGEVSFDTGALVVAGIASDRGTGRLRLAGDTATVVLDLWDGERTVVGVDGEVDLAARSVRARRLSFAPTPDLAWREDGVQTVRLVDGGVADVRLRFVSGTSVLAVSGSGAKGGMVDLTLDARDARLDWLATVWPDRFAGYSGRLDVRASMEGHASRPALYVDASGQDLVVPDVVQGLDLDVQGVGGDRRLQVDGELRANRETLARVDGDLPFSLAVDDPGLLVDGDVDLRVEVPPSGQEAWGAVLPGVELPTFRASGELALTGPLRDPALRAVAAVTAPTGPSGDWVRVDLDGSTVDGQFHVRTVLRERLERRAEVDGTVDLHLGDVVRGVLGEGPEVDLGSIATWAGAVELDVVPLRLPVHALGTFVDLPASFTGDLSGGLHVSGQARAPRLEGALFLSRGRLGELPLSPALVSLGPAEGGYRVDANLGFGAASALTVSGFVPFDPTLESDLSAELRRDGLALSVTGEDVPLAAVGAAWPTLTEATGTMRANGTITGSLADPYPDIAFGLDDGSFVLGLTGVAYRDVSFGGRLTHDELTVQDLEVRTLRAGLPDALAQEGRVTGRVVARRVGDRPVVDGVIALDRAWIVDTAEQVLRADGTIRLSGTDALRVTGQVDVVEGQLLVPERFFTGTSDLQLHPDVQVFRGRTEDSSLAREARAEFALPTWLDMEVEVDLDRHAFLDASLPMEQMLGSALKGFSSISVADTQLDGEVVVGAYEGQLSLVGQVVPLRGTARVFGVPFDVAGRTISFTGRDYTDPVLDLVATHDAGECGVITTAITGTPSDLGLAFSSDKLGVPEEDLLRYLLLGCSQALEPATAVESADLLSAALAVVKSQVPTTTRGLDVFELDTTGIRAGRRLTDQVFLLGSVNWTADPEKENVGEVTLEVQLDRHWQFDFTTGTSAISSIGLYRRWRF